MSSFINQDPKILWNLILVAQWGLFGSSREASDFLFQLVNMDEWDFKWPYNSTNVALNLNENGSFQTSLIHIPTALE